MPKANLIKQLEEVRKKDERRTFAEFYLTFDLDDYYSSSMVHLLMSGKRQPRNMKILDFLERCIQIYDQYTDNYVMATPDALSAMLVQTEERYEMELSIDTLRRQIHGNNAVILGALKKKHNQFSNDLYDLFDHQLFEKRRTPDSMTNTVDAYQELLNRIMRDAIADGTKILTKREIAERSQVDLEILEHPEVACHDAKLYMEVYEKLVLAQQDYAISRK